MNIFNLINPNIRKLKPYICARHTAQNGILLDANENPYGNINRYPDPNCTEIKNELSKMLGVKPENLFIGNGSDEAIMLLFMIFCRKGDTVITLEPTYGMYRVCADTFDIEVNPILLNEDFQIDVEKTLSAITKSTKIIFACSPNNPTANCLRDTDIFELCEKFKGIVVVDEAYIEFSDTESLVKKIEQYPNLIVLRTLSKAWGMAGIRLGYAVAQKEIIEAFNKTKAPYNVNILTQREALKNLKNKIKMEKNKKLILSERERVKKELQTLGIKVYPSDANFLLIKIPTAVKIQKEMQDDGVIVRERSIEPLIPNCLRITIGTKKENDIFLKKFKENLIKVAFIDRDGVILFEPQDDFQVDSLKKYKILPGVFEGLKKLKKAGYKLVMVSNQDGIGTPSFPEKDFLVVQNKMVQDLWLNDTPFDEIFICPHFASENCECRKPKIGLIKKFLEKTPLNYAESFVIGDRESDMELAKNIGLKGIKTKVNGTFPTRSVAERIKN